MVPGFARESRFNEIINLQYPVCQERIYHPLIIPDAKKNIGAKNICKQICFERGAIGPIPKIIASKHIFSENYVFFHYSCINYKNIVSLLAISVFSVVFGNNSRARPHRSRCTNNFSKVYFKVCQYTHNIY